MLTTHLATAVAVASALRDGGDGVDQLSKGAVDPADCNGEGAVNTFRIFFTTTLRREDDDGQSCSQPCDLPVHSCADAHKIATELVCGTLIVYSQIHYSDSSAFS